MSSQGFTTQCLTLCSHAAFFTTIHDQRRSWKPYKKPLRFFLYIFIHIHSKHAQSQTAAEVSTATLT